VEKRNFRALLEAQWSRGNYACVGPDSPDGDRVCAIVDSTHDLVCAYKPNRAFYEADGEALQPFLDHADKGLIVLCRTSNPGAGEFQDLEVVTTRSFTAARTYTTTLYNVVARQVAKKWNQYSNCALVVVATCPKELRTVRQIVGDMPILIPGIGAQGGDVEKTVSAGTDSRGQGMITNSSRSIIFASNGPDFAAAARRETKKLRDLINQYRLATPKQMA